MSDDYKLYDDQGQQQELTIDHYKAIVGQLTATIQLMEDRINGIDRDYDAILSQKFNVADFAASMTDKPHWRWEAD